MLFLHFSSATLLHPVIICETQNDTDDTYNTEDTGHFLISLYASILKELFSFYSSKAQVTMLK